MSYVAEYFDGSAPCIKSFDNLPEMAQWATFNHLRISPLLPVCQFGEFRPRHYNGSRLNIQELAELERPVSSNTCIFPQEALVDMRAYELLLPRSANAQQPSPPDASREER